MAYFQNHFQIKPKLKKKTNKQTQGQSLLRFHLSSIYLDLKVPIVVVDQTPQASVLKLKI